MGVRDRSRSALRATLGSLGLEVHRVDRGPRRTLAQVAANARSAGLEARGVIDVGVARGTPGLYEAWPAARLLLIEPLLEWEGYLQEHTRGRGDYLLAAAGPAGGEVAIQVHRVPELSSVIGERDEGQTTTRRVPRVKIDEAARELEGPLVVKLDVEGGELEALRGAEAVLARTELLLLETSLFELVPQQPLVTEVVQYLADRDFVLYDVFGGHLRLLDGALAQVDLAFAPRQGVLRTEQRYGTAAQTDALYRSWGR
jgi:FkbM family methyltransferase